MNETKNPWQIKKPNIKQSFGKSANPALNMAKGKPYGRKFAKPRSGK